MDRELHRDPTGVADPVAHARRELQMVPVAGHEVAAGLGDTDDRLARAQFVGRSPIIHKALEVERSLVYAAGIIEPVARAEPALWPGSISRHHKMLLEVGRGEERSPRVRSLPHQRGSRQ